MKGFSGLVIFSLCFLVGCGLLLSALGGHPAQTKSTVATNQPATVTPPVDLKETLKAARDYAAQNNEEGVLMELGDLSQEDLQHPEVQKLYQTATRQKAIKARKSYADSYERGLLTEGMDVTVRTSGKEADTMTITYVLTNRAVVYQMESNTDLRTQWRQLGFKTVRMSDGFNSTWSFKVQ